MIKRIENWFSNYSYRENRRREQILKDIKKAKQIFLNEEEDYMCYCFRAVNCGKYLGWKDIHKVIPEFIPQTFGRDIPSRGAWWNISDRESRINAFNKLIEIYSK
jgi:hypothetical protein